MTNLTTLPDEELNELAAVEVMGMTLIDERPLQHFYEGVRESATYPLQNEYFRVEYKRYNPLSNTPEGISQAIELADKCEMEINFEEKSAIVIDKNGLLICRSFEIDKTWQRAIVIAAILSVRGE